MSDSQKHETIADIIAKKRARANRIERIVAENQARGKMTSGWFVRDLIASIREDADRLEAAWKREKAEIEADALNVGAVVATTEKSSAVGNAAAMRDALKTIYMEAQYILDNRKEPAIVAHRANIIERKVNTALSAPARNCDVGTAEEQEDRFDKFCDSHKWVDDEGAIVCASKCPLYNANDCYLLWAMMPYEDGGAADET